METGYGVVESRRKLLVNSTSILPDFVGQTMLLKILVACQENPCQSRESDIALPWV